MGAAEQQQFSQYPLRYGDGTLGAAIAQTRGGKDELVTPVALWELDGTSGLYLPPGLSQNPRRPRVDAQLSGSLIEQVGGADVIRTKQAGLAYLSWDFNDTATLTLAAGAQVREAVSREVNGYSTLAAIMRPIPTDPNWADHTYKLFATWQSIPGDYTSERSVEEIIIDSTDVANNKYGTASVISTASQHVFLRAQNNDTVSHDYHIHGMLRA